MEDAGFGQLTGKVNCRHQEQVPADDQTAQTSACTWMICYLTEVTHTQNPNLLERFGIKMNGKLSHMIPDRRFYHGMYELFFFDKTLLVYRKSHHLEKDL